MKNHDRGFTLIELLVVIAIIAVLAALILASLGGAKKRGNDARIISDIRELRTQMENDRTPTDYSNSFTTPLAASVSFGSATAAQYAVLVSDARANSTITTATASSTYANGGSSPLAGNAYGQTANSPEVVVVENGTASSAAWQVKPTAYSIWGYLSTGNWFCLDSAGNTKNGTSANPTNIICQ